jgi:hypothetical protein
VLVQQFRDLEHGPRGFASRAAIAGVVGLPDFFASADRQLCAQYGERYQDDSDHEHGVCEARLDLQCTRLVRPAGTNSLEPPLVDSADADCERDDDGNDEQLRESSHEIFIGSPGRTAKPDRTRA